MIRISSLVAAVCSFLLTVSLSLFSLSPSKPGAPRHPEPEKQVDQQNNIFVDNSREIIAIRQMMDTYLSNLYTLNSKANRDLFFHDQAPVIGISLDRRDYSPTWFRNPDEWLAGHFMTYDYRVRKLDVVLLSDHVAVAYAETPLFNVGVISTHVITLDKKDGLWKIVSETYMTDFLR